MCNKKKKRYKCVWRRAHTKVPRDNIENLIVEILLVGSTIKGKHKQRS
jgi:hypothetical protein